MQDLFCVSKAGAILLRLLNVHTFPNGNHTVLSDNTCLGKVGAQGVVVFISTKYVLWLYCTYKWREISLAVLEIFIILVYSLCNRLNLIGSH